MRRIAVFSDIHGNYEALKEVCNDIHNEGITEIYSLGDNIAIGPEPKETVDLLISNNVHSIKGNHEMYYLDIIKNGTTDIYESELKHQLWISKELGKRYYNYLNELDYEIRLDIDGLKIYMCHYAFVSEEGVFKNYLGLDEVIDSSSFLDIEADLYIFGHQHLSLHNYKDKNVELINLKSSGATIDDNTSYVIIEINDGKYKTTEKILKYDKSKVIKRINSKEMPERDFVKKIFFGIEE